MATNPHALENAQDDDERFELMQPPPSTFDPYKDRPISTNTYATRSHVHANGLWHCSVHIWIVNPTTSKILLQKRSMSKDRKSALVLFICMSLWVQYEVS